MRVAGPSPFLKPSKCAVTAGGGEPRVISPDDAKIFRRAGRTTRVTVLVTVAYYVESAGLKVTDSVCAPAASTVPTGGEYKNVPGTDAVALSSHVASS